LRRGKALENCPSSLAAGRRKLGGRGRGRARTLGTAPNPVASVPPPSLPTRWAPRPPNEARVVWEWHVWDHLVQTIDPKAPGYGVPSEHPGRLDVNGDRDAPIIDEEELE